MNGSILQRWSSLPGDWPRDARPLRYIALRFTPRQQELFDSKGVSYHAVVSNRDELEAAADCALAPPEGRHASNMCIVC